MNILWQHLSDPEYLHILINPMPVYGLAIGVLALALALILRNQRVTIAALVLVFVSALSAWPTYHYGEAAYDRVKAMSDPAGEQWLDEHMARGEKMIWLFYVLAGVAAIGVGAVLKWPRTSFAITVGTLLLGGATLGTGGYIAYAGGHVRHKEFRFEPPPQARAEEHHHHGDEHEHGEEQKAETSSAQQMEHAGHEQTQQSGGEQPKSEEERKQLEASRLQLEASRMQLEASRKQLEAAGGASPVQAQVLHRRHNHRRNINTNTIHPINQKMTRIRINKFFSFISMAGLLIGCAATGPPPLPQHNPADPQVRSISKAPRDALVRDETTLAIEKQLSATETDAKSAESMHHDMNNMPGMQHGDMQHGTAAQPEKKAVADEMKKTADEMKNTSDQMKQKSDEMKPVAALYTCPMHPQIKSNKPGKCPICGMTLIKKESSKRGGEDQR